MTHSYRAYGLTLHSDCSISALREEPTHFEAPDVVIHLGSEPDWARTAMHLPFRIERPRAGEAYGNGSPFILTSSRNGEFLQLDYGEGARFVVDSAATRILGIRLPPLTDEDLATYLLGPVMGFVLRRRGIVSLHASSVMVFGNAVVLCGPSDSGKSTTAAALAMRGVPVLAEDISPIAEENGTLSVEPGYPRVCLWPDAVKILFRAPNALPRLTPTWEKRYLALDEDSAKFAREKAPLGLVYVFAPRVDDGDAPRIEAVGVRDALLELIRNTYMNWLLDRHQRAAELDLLTRVVESVLVRRIVPHTDPARIGALCDLIVEDAGRLVGRRAVAAISEP